MRDRLVLLLAMTLAGSGSATAQVPATEFAADRAAPAIVPAVSAVSTPIAPAAPPGLVTPAPAAALGNPAARAWVRAEAGSWSLKGDKAPPLVTAAPATSSALVPGALSNPDTTVLFGNQNLPGGNRSGIRVQAGFWWDDDATSGIDGSAFDVCPWKRGYQVGSNGTSLSLFRPIFNTLTGRPGVEDVTSLADGITGRVGVQSETRLCGGEVNCRQPLCADQGCCCGYRIDGLVGYRVLDLNETLGIAENLTTLDLAGLPNGNIAVTDSFRTRNVFQGAQAGIDAEWWQENWVFGLRGSLAAGVVQQSVDVSGSTVTRAIGGQPVTAVGGLLALPTNIGDHHRDVFGISPGLGVRIGYQCTSWMRVSIGYDALWLNSVVRPGSQIDLGVNPNQVPPALSPPFVPARPAFAFRESDFWAQGLSVGVEFRF